LGVDDSDMEQGKRVDDGREYDESILYACTKEEYWSPQNVFLK
jgi:hypothetical protein